MPLVGGIIKKPVSLADINSQIGAGYNLKSLCVSIRVNRWSKYKPVKHASLRPLTEAEWKSVNYGFVTPPLRSGMNPSVTAEDEWTYEQPTAVFRQSDYENYMHSAKPINRKQKDFEYNLMFQNEVEIRYHYDGIQGIDTYRMQLDDFEAIKGYYLCLWIREKGKTDVYWKTSANTIETTGQIILTDADIRNAGNGKEYEYGLCACSVKKEDLSSPAVTAMFYALPANKASDLTATFTVSMTSPLSMTLTGIASLATGTVDGVYASPATYMGKLTESDLINPLKYYNVGTHYNLQLKYSITNTGSSAVAFYRPLLVYYLSKTFVANKEVRAYFSHIWAYEDGTYVEIVESNGITILPGQTKTVVFEIGDAMLKSNGSAAGTPVTGQLLSVNISMQYDSLTLQRVTALRIRN